MTRRPRSRSWVALGLVLCLACEATPDTGANRAEISYARFSEDVRTYQVSEVTIFKPNDPEKDLFRIEGRYGHRAGKKVTRFVTFGRINEDVIASLKAAGVAIQYQE